MNKLFFQNFIIFYFLAIFFAGRSNDSITNYKKINRMPIKIILLENPVSSTEKSSNFSLKRKTDDLKIAKGNLFNPSSSFIPEREENKSELFVEPEYLSPTVSLNKNYNSNNNFDSFDLSSYKKTQNKNAKLIHPQQKEFIFKDSMVFDSRFSEVKFSFAKTYDLFEQKNSNFQFSDFTNFFFSFVAIYLGFFGFRFFRILMTFLGFYISYYLLMLFFYEYAEMELKNSLLIFSFFFLSLIFGLLLSLLAYTFEKINYFIFGIALSIMISLVLAQFFFDIKSTEHQIMIFIIFLTGFCFFSILAFIFFDHCLIIGSAFIGATQVPINFGIIFRDIEPFYTRKILGRPEFRKLYPYLLLFLLMMVLGLVTQYQLRNRILKRIQEKKTVYKNDSQSDFRLSFDK